MGIPTDSRPPDGLFRVPRRALEVLLAVALFCMMLLTFIDVVGRYLFNSPLPGAKELTELLLTIVVFGGAPLVTAAKEHITTALFDDVLTPGVRRLRDVSVSIVGAVACAALGRQMWVQGDLASSLGASTPLLEVPTAPFIYAMAVLSAICALILLVMMAAAATGRPQSPGNRDTIA
jgi:TRAP-type C4-dicarboxylate transport system permease small subunit